MTLFAFASEASNPWGWSWETLVALGTIGLAVGTLALAVATRNVAKKTTEVANKTTDVASRTEDLATAARDDLRAQWRPILVPGPDRPAYSEGARRLTLTLHNAGRGPALHVRAQIEDPGEYGAQSPKGFPLGVLAPGEESFVLVFDLASSAGVIGYVQLLVDYRDLAGSTYSTSVTYTKDGEGWKAYDVRLWADHSVTTLDDAVYPRPGLRDVRPSTDPSKRAGQ